MHRQHVPVQDLYSVKLSVLEVTLGQYCAYSLKLTQYPIKPMDPVYWFARGWLTYAFSRRLSGVLVEKAGVHVAVSGGQKSTMSSLLS